MWVAVTALLLVSGMALRLSRVPENIKRTDESTNFKAVVVHCDNRPLSDKDPSAVTIQDMSFIDMASMVDYAYAKKHGYEFKHYVLPRGTYASHSIYFPEFGLRHSAWLKLLVLKHVGNEHPNADLLLLHDSDTAVSNHGPSLSEFMDSFTLTEYKDDEGDPNQPPPSTCNYAGDTSRLKQTSGIWLNQGCKGHAILARPGQQAWEVLKQAWNYPQHHQTFPWEQAAWDYLAAVQTRGLLMVGGMNLTQQQCNADIEIPGFNKHMCHFQDDSFAMGAVGDRSARDRIRKYLGCGHDWKNKCLNNTEYQDEVSEHNFLHGQRKLTFLNMLRDLGYDDSAIYRLYREMRAKVAYFTEQDVTAVAAQLYDASAAYAKTMAEQNADTFNFKFRDLFKVADPIPEGSRERQCWCDGP